MRELILYATPVGPLASACREFFDASTPTTAHTYPPHVTLTGFFRRGDARADAMVERAREVLADAGPPSAGSIEVVDLLARPDWVGLEVSSQWLTDLASTFARGDVARAEEDAIRLKTWLHLSLAYGVDDLSAHAAMANELVDPALPVEWEVSLWERLPTGRWRRHEV